MLREGSPEQFLIYTSTEAMKHGNLIIIFTLILTFWSAAPCRAVGDDSLAGYLEQALAGNDQLRAVRSKFRASSERIRQAGVLPDPKLSIQYYLQPVETRTGPQNAAVGISQSVPWFHKLSLLRKLSEHDASIAGIQLAAIELDVTRQVKEAYIEYSFLGRSQRTIADNLELLRYLEGVARSRYAGGKSTFFDVLKIQIEQSRTEEQYQTVTDKTEPLRIHINGLLGTEKERARPVPDALPQVVLVKAEEEIHSSALANAPILMEAREGIDRARTGKELAEQDFYPDFNFSLKTIFTGSAEFGTPPDSGEDPVIAGLTVNLPVFRDRRHGKVAETTEMVHSAQAFRQQQIRLLATEIEQALYGYRTAQRQIVLYRDDLLPKVEQQLEVAINGFQSGQSSILELIDAEKNMLAFKLAENRAVADRALAVARLEQKTGMILADWTKQE